MRMLFVLAVALSSLPPAAWTQEVTTELYGEFRYSYNRADGGDDSHWASANNASRLGVRGTISERSLTGFVDLQVNVGIDDPDAFARRYYLAGVRGPFGSITIGRHSTAYKLAGVRLDPFFDYSTVSPLGGVPSTGLFAGSTFGQSNLTNSFTDRAISYVTPAVAGITANAALYLDPESDHDYAAGVGYLARGFDVGVQYYQADGADNWNVLAAPSGIVDNALRGHVGYSRPGRWSLGALAERLESEAGPSQDYYWASGTVSPVRRLMLAAAMGHVSDSGALQPVTGNGFHGGVFYDLLPGARVHALYSLVDVDDGPSRSNGAVGLTYAFLLRP